MSDDTRWKTVLRTMTIAFAWVASGTGFAADQIDTVRTLIRQREESRAADRAVARDQEAKVPAVVRQLANSYIDDDQAIGVSLDREASVLVYSRAFLVGFAAPDLAFPGMKGIVPVATAAGAAFLRDHPEQLDAIMTSYGYIRRPATGICSGNFEINRFDADDAPMNDLHMKETWWLSGLGKVHSTLPPVAAKSPISSVSRACRVDGYLSQRGRYGHEGLFDRDFKATDIAPVGPRPASSARP